MKSFGLYINSLVLLTVSVVNSQITCQDRYEAILGETAEVSCMYDDSFHTVRWYEYGSDESFLRLDGGKKYGSGHESGEFDITLHGSMIINKVNIEHEGNYTISVLHEDGHGSSETVHLYVIAPLNNIVLHDCTLSTSSKVCAHVPKEEINSTILCLADDVRPAVKFTWLIYSSDGQQEVYGDFHFNITLDDATSLYTTRSSLHFDNSLFALQYFTCVASGYAVKEVRNASVLVPGRASYSNVETAWKYVMEGETIQLSCSITSFPLSYAKISMSDEGDDIWMNISPSPDKERCINKNVCVFPVNALVVIKEVDRNKDFIFECFHGDGTIAEKHITNVTVMVIPENSIPKIHGCEGSEQCSENIPSTGTIKCSLFGVKPQLPLVMRVQEDSSADVEFTDVKNVAQKDFGSVTWSTHYSATYEIKECVPQVTLECLTVVSQEQAPNQLMSSTVDLHVDKSSCSGESKEFLVPVLVVIFILIIVAVIFAVAYKYRKDSLSKRRNEIQENEQEVKEDCSNIEIQENEQEVKEDCSNIEHQEREQVFIEEMETENCMTRESTSNLDSEDVNGVRDGNCSEQHLHSVSDRSTSVQQANVLPEEEELVESQVQTFKPNEDEEETRNLLDPETSKHSFSDRSTSVEQVNMVPKEEKLVETQVLISKESQVSSSPLNEENETTEVDALKEKNVDNLLVPFIKEPNDDMREEILQLAKQSLYEYLKEQIQINMEVTEDMIYAIIKAFSICHANEWITTTERSDLIEVTVEKLATTELRLRGLGIAYALKQIGDRQYSTMIKPLADELQQDAQDLADSIVHYFVTSDIAQEFVTPIIGYKGLQNKIPYPYIVKSIQSSFQGDQNKGRLLPLLKEVVDKTSYYKIIQRSDSKHVLDTEDLSTLFLQLSFLSVQEKSINAERCADILKSSLQEGKITTEKYQDVVRSSCKNVWMNAETILAMLHQGLARGLHDNDFFHKIMTLILQNEKIHLNQWVDEIKLCSKERLVSPDVLHLQVKDFISNRDFGWYEDKWLKLVFDLLKTKSLSEKNSLDIFQTIVDKYKITEDQLQPILKLPSLNLTSKQKNVAKKLKFKRRTKDEDMESSTLLGNTKKANEVSQMFGQQPPPDEDDAVKVTAIRKLDT